MAGKTSQSKAKKDTKELTIQKSAKLAEIPKKSTSLALKEEDKASAAKEEKKEVKTTASKTAATKAPARKKASAKAEAKTVVVENYFEIGEDQVKAEDVRARIEQAYKDAGHRISTIKKLQVYYNFEERRAYYVINDKAEGAFVEF